MNTLLFVGKTEGLSWNSESYFHFRTQRNPFHKSSKVACEELVFFMPSVKSDTLAKQTGSFTGIADLPGE